MVEVEDTQGEHGGRLPGGVEREEDEEPSVVLSHTVVDPGAVVVKFADALNIQFYSYKLHQNSIYLTIRRILKCLFF